LAKAQSMNPFAQKEFDKIPQAIYAPEEYFELGWMAAINVLSKEFMTKWEQSELEDTQLLHEHQHIPMPDDEAE
jgi:hypothetical protein